MLPDLKECRLIVGERLEHSGRVLRLGLMCAAGHFRTASPDLKIQLPEAFDQENEPAGRPLARFAGLGFLLGRLALASVSIRMLKR